MSLIQFTLYKTIDHGNIKKTILQKKGHHAGAFPARRILIAAADQA